MINNKTVAQSNYAAICHFQFDKVKHFAAAMAPHAVKLQGDIPCYTDIKPVIQVSEVIITWQFFMRWLYLFASCWLLVVAGCASSGVVKNVTPVLTTAPVSLDFVLVETSGSTTNMETGEQLLKDKLITGLRETQLFGAVTGNKEDIGSGSGMKIDACIKQIKMVSPSARVWFGALAGHARVSVEVKVSDLNSGNQIQAFEVEGESGASAMAGTTDQTIEQTSQQIVAEIIRISRQTSQ